MASRLETGRMDRVRLVMEPLDRALASLSADPVRRDHIFELNVSLLFIAPAPNGVTLHVGSVLGLW